LGALIPAEMKSLSPPSTWSIAIALALSVGSGCASVHRGTREETPVQEIRMEPLVIAGDVQLDGLNDEELFASGESAFAAQDYRRAARYFDRLVDFHPESKHFRAATYNAGLAHEKNGEWEDALSRFTQLADAGKGTGDALDAAFRQAEVLYHLTRYADAIVILSELAARTDLSRADRLQAQVQRGVCEVEDGRPEAAEASFRSALADYQSVEDKGLVDDFYPAQAQFFLGEIYRLRYQIISLDPDKSVDELAKDLEYKAELLLSAQGHYLRAIRMGNGYWSTASGERIGGLYESLYEQMVSSPVPKELDAEEAQVYRQELRKKVRVLITKAINVYERTLEAAERIGAANPFVERTRESLRKMKELLLADAKKDDEARTAN
jgi:tetratricopeptide (TPR) repeat protein